MQLSRTLISDPALTPFPMHQIDWMGDNTAKVWLKIEWSDPAGDDPLRTIKRKPAWFMFHDALKRGYLSSGKILISATSGNLGIEFALLAQKYNIPFYCVAPGAILPEGIQILKDVGANVIRTAEQEVCPREFTVFYARGYSHEFHHRLVNLDQFFSWLNPLAHSYTTAKEIFENNQVDADAVFTCLGSCGTVGGILHYIGMKNLNVQVFGAQPAKNQGVPGTHIIKGDCIWSPENYSPVVLPDENIATVDNIDAFAFTVKLWQKGIPAGPSTGMALSLAYKKIRAGLSGNMVVISADSNLKYPDLLATELSQKKDEILKRYPELELAEPIEQYLAELEKAAGENHLTKSIQNCYSIEKPGNIFEVQDIEEIIKAH